MASHQFRIRLFDENNEQVCPFNRIRIKVGPLLESDKREGFLKKAQTTADKLQDWVDSGDIRKLQADFLKLYPAVLKTELPKGWEMPEDKTRVVPVPEGPEH